MWPFDSFIMTNTMRKRDGINEGVVDGDKIGRVSRSHKEGDTPEGAAWLTDDYEEVMEKEETPLLFGEPTYEKRENGSNDEIRDYPVEGGEASALTSMGLLVHWALVLGILAPIHVVLGGMILMRTTNRNYSKNRTNSIN